MASPSSITASMPYNYVQCPHRVTMDLFGNPGEKIPSGLYPDPNEDDCIAMRVLLDRIAAMNRCTR